MFGEISGDVRPLDEFAEGMSEAGASVGMYYYYDFCALFFAFNINMRLL
jgi:hypothetical protein